MSNMERALKIQNFVLRFFAQKSVNVNVHTRLHCIQKTLAAFNKKIFKRCVYILQQELYVDLKKVKSSRCTHTSAPTAHSYFVF